MKKIKIKSYHGAGWLAPILGDDFKKLEKYCKEWDQTIEHFCPSANETTYQEFIDGFDVFSWALDGEDFFQFVDSLVKEIDDEGSTSSIIVLVIVISISIITPIGINFRFTIPAVGHYCRRAKFGGGN